MIRIKNVEEICIRENITVQCDISNLLVIETYYILLDSESFICLQIKVCIIWIDLFFHNTTIDTYLAHILAMNNSIRFSDISFTLYEI